MGKRLASLSPSAAAGLKRIKMEEHGEVNVELVEESHEVGLYEGDGILEENVVHIPEEGEDGDAAQQAIDEVKMEATVVDFGSSVVHQAPDGKTLYIIQPKDAPGAYVGQTTEFIAAEIKGESLSDDADAAEAAAEPEMEFTMSNIDLDWSVSALHVGLIQNSLLEPTSIVKEVLVLNEQVLNPDQSFASQCVNASGLVQVKLVVRRNEDGTVTLNIQDILQNQKPSVCASSKRGTDTQRIHRYKPRPKPAPKPANNAQQQVVSAWAQSEEFLQLLEQSQLSPDANTWPNEAIHLWLSWASQYFDLSSVNIEEVCMTGAELHQMDIAQLKKSINTNDDHFWMHTDILRNSGIVSTLIGARDQKSLGRGNRSGNNGQIQLWQFLLDLLLSIEHQGIIDWVGKDGEFMIKNHGEVAQRWGELKKKDNMTYDKMSRAMRYYYHCNLMKKVPGKRFTYKFTCNLKEMIGLSAAEIQDIIHCPTAALGIDDQDGTSLRSKIEGIRAMLRTPGSIKKPLPGMLEASEFGWEEYVS